MTGCKVVVLIKYDRETSYYEGWILQMESPNSNNCFIVVAMLVKYTAE